MRKVFFGQLRAAEMEVGVYLQSVKRQKKIFLSFSFVYCLFLAFDWTLLVCGDRDLFSLYSLQGWFLSSLCGPFHFAAFPQMLSLAGWRQGGLCEWTRVVKKKITIIYYISYIWFICYCFWIWCFHILLFDHWKVTSHLENKIYLKFKIYYICGLLIYIFILYFRCIFIYFIINI